MSIWRNTPIGGTAVLKSLNGPPTLVERLYEIGFLPGETLVFLGRAPFGGPWLFEVRGTTVALRDEEAECLRT